jgi:exopolyphosphatase/guanosine-5'-triphosphate,3'-diphosphate pyrophosphatase
MPGEVRAVIDVGTNSVKLLVADVRSGNNVVPLHESSQQTRLGQGFYESHTLQPGAIDLTAKAVADFVNEAQRWQPARIKIVGTSAARDAANKDQLLHAIEAASGIPVTVISGEHEADWAYKGVTSDPQLAARNLLVMDLGGGSTEFILGSGGRRLFAESFPLGSVRLLERIPVSDPPTEAERQTYQREIRNLLENHVAPKLLPRIRELSDPAQLVGTGGTSTILARVELKLRSFSRELIEGTLLSREMVRSETLRLWRTSWDERKKWVGLPPNRADVILPGAAIFDQVMEIFGFESLRVSTRGLRFAAVMD